LNQKAVALKYDQSSDIAPSVIAKGEGEIAKRVIQKAKEFDIPLFQNEALANSLLGLEVGESIPPELYVAVVEVFAWLYRSEQSAQISSAV
jgi:flagellar biosynthesis protein